MPGLTGACHCRGLLLGGLSRASRRRGHLHLRRRAGPPPDGRPPDPRVHRSRAEGTQRQRHRQAQDRPEPHGRRNARPRRKGARKADGGAQPAGRGEEARPRAAHALSRPGAHDKERQAASRPGGRNDRRRQEQRRRTGGIAQAPGDRTGVLSKRPVARCRAKLKRQIEENEQHIEAQQRFVANSEPDPVQRSAAQACQVPENPGEGGLCRD